MGERHHSASKMTAVLFLDATSQWYRTRTHVDIVYDEPAGINSLPSYNSHVVAPFLFSFG